MSSKFIIIRVLLFVLLVVGTTSAMIAQDNDFTTWTKFKVNHKIDSRFAVSGNLELKTGSLASACRRCTLFWRFMEKPFLTLPPLPPQRA